MFKLIKEIKKSIDFYSLNPEDKTMMLEGLTSLHGDISYEFIWKNMFSVVVVQHYLYSLLKGLLDGDEESVTFTNVFYINSERYKIEFGVDIRPNFAASRKGIDESDMSKYLDFITTAFVNNPSLDIKLKFSNIRIHNIIHEETGMVVCGSIFVCKNANFSGYMRELPIILERYASLFNQFDSHDNKLDLIGFFTEHFSPVILEGSDMIDISASLCSKLVRFPISLTSGIQLNSDKAWKFYHTDTIDASYVAVKQLPDEYLTNEFIRNGIIKDLPDDDKIKVNNLLKLKGNIQ